MGIAVLLLTITTTARAGGSSLEPTWVRVEAGDPIALSGEVSSGQLGWVDDGPYFAHLSGEEYGLTISEGIGGFETDVLLGQLQIEASGNSARVSIEFTMPKDAPSGEYWVTVCNDPCRTGFGDLLGSTLFVGIDPPADGAGISDTAAVDVADPSGAEASTALAVAEAPEEAPSTERVGLALARHPERATGLNATWVAISAAFGLLALLLVSMVRTKGG